MKHSNDERLLIKDSCIFFDLIDLELLNPFFQLGFEVFTTSYVINEITDDSQITEVNSYVSLGVLIVDFEGSFEAIQEIYEQCKGLSYTDCSVVELAFRKNATVLSSDKALRNEIKRRKLTVRGVLWIIEELLNRDIISIEFAISKLKIYNQINSRAPKAEISKLICILEDKTTT